MIVEETFYRPTELARERRMLPAAVYNLARLLLSRAPHGCLFVPIRSMQYLAVLDAEECIFVDREGRRTIELSWQRFVPHERTALDDPVAYEAVYYTAAARDLMPRVQPEFHKALQALSRRQTLDGPARVVKLDARTS